MIPANAN